jgi:hypothetical protein
MKHKKKQINNKKERVILSDVLPFEIPITFSNRHFHNFLVNNHISTDGKMIKWDKNDPILEIIVKLLFGFKKDNPVNDRQININNGERKTIPFNYKISHKDNDFRELTIIHPKDQLAVIEFYEKYKNMILYYCNISPFSIRRPVKIAKFSYYKDRTHIEKLAHDNENKSIEEFDKEYENLKTFFVYKEYSNIYKFYESYKYQRCEKKYNRLFKFDITRCFDSIYSHSISWALLNKEVVKENIKESKKTFGGKFDSLMQNLNYGETNGIVIGPEFSRLFAELILQRIDLNVFRNLKKEKIKFRTDYEIFRYVDDYFIFYNEEKTKDEILKEYKCQLMEYKLYLNDSKSVLFEKPIITNITIAKLNISDLLNNNLNFEFLRKESKNNEEKNEKKYCFYISANKLITKFKKIIKEANIPYKDILNYTLACIDRKTLKLIDIYNEIDEKNKFEKKVTEAVLELLDFTLFLYCVSPRVNTTIKLSLILSKLIKFIKLKGNFYHDNRHIIFKKIYDDIFLVLKKNKSSKYTELETLYLLIALKELGKEYRLDNNILCNYFNIDQKVKSRDHCLNYFSITVLLFYIGNKKRYRDIKDTLKEHIRCKFEKVQKNNRIKMTELTILLFDLLSCPFLEDDFKKELLEYYDITNVSEVNKIVARKDYWFTKWDNFDFGKELEAKKSLEVY